MIKPIIFGDIRGEAVEKLDLVSRIVSVHEDVLDV